MIITLNLTEMEWEVLRPLLESKMIDNKPIEPKYVDYEYIASLPHGTRICNILKDGEWGYYRESSIVYEHELKAISKAEYMRHRNAGAMTWELLKNYINTL